MHNFKEAFVGGFRQSLQWRLWLPLYLTGLLFGLAQTWPVWVFGQGGTNPHLAAVAGGDLDTGLNLLLGNEAVQVAAGTGVLLWLGLSGAVVLLYGLAYNFFAGGILSRWAGRSEFWAGCRRFFWPFVGWGVLLTLLLGISFLAVVLLASLSPGLGVVGALLAVTFLSLLGETVRSLAVIRDERNPVKLVGAAIVFGLRRPWGMAALAGSGLVLQLGVWSLYLPLPGLLEGTVIVVMGQQTVALLWLWVKLLRLAWVLNYVRVVAEQPSSSVSSPHPVIP